MYPSASQDGRNGFANYTYLMIENNIVLSVEILNQSANRGQVDNIDKRNNKTLCIISDKYKTEN